MKKWAAIGWLTFVVTLCVAGIAQAEITVDIIGTQPTDGSIGDGETLKLYWRIESTSSGTYDVEVGGDGTVGSGTAVAASDGSGSYSGTMNGTTTISADNDLEDGDGEYQIYVIATSGTETAYATTSISLDTPPTEVLGFSVGRGDGKLFLTWDPLDISDLDHYLVYYGTSPGTNPEDYTGADASEGASPIDVDDVDNFQLSGLTNNVKYYVRISAVDTSDTEGPLSSELSGTPTDTVGFTELSNDEGGCFVATAAWGDYNHPMVKQLRSFRDRILQRTPAGRAFVHLYYAVSPPLAHWLAGHPTARAATRAVLTPIARLAGWETERPGMISVPLLLGLAAILVLARRRREEAR
ncbi:MAG: fibronectin type III domain-containing protein [Myxococcales bacterium]|nr:fibronectin type III domain-containing protein [Myxococcales bacterium]